MSKPKIAIISVVSTLVLLFVVSLVAKRFASPAQAPATVRLEKAQRGDITEVVSATGETEPKTKVSISARVSARILEMPFEEGAHVVRGDPCANPPVAPSILVRLDAKDLESQLAAETAGRAAQAAQIEVQKTTVLSQQANVKRLDASLRNARRDCERQKKLMDSNYVSAADFDTAQCKLDELIAEYDSAKNQVQSSQQTLEVLEHNLEAADAQIAKAKDALTYTLITSPINGTVTQRKAKVGELVITGTMNNPGTMILEVADLARMLFVAQVDESEVTKLVVGQPCKVRLPAFRDRIFDGKVDTVALVQTNEQSASAKYFRTEVLIADANEKILSGLTGEVDIETKTHKGIIKIPSQAVLARSADEIPAANRDCPEVEKNKALTAVVFRNVKGKAVITPVKIGPSDLTHTCIVSGLAEGDEVITGPYKALDTIKHDQAVTPETAKDAKPGKGKA